MARQLTPEWQIWLSTNIQRKCSKESMILSMVKAGFQTEEASQIISAAYGMPPSSHKPSDSLYHYEDSRIHTENTIQINEQKIDVRMRIKQPDIVLFDHVLSDKECDELIQRSRVKLRRSTTVNTVSGKEDVIAERTSEGTFFQRCEDSFIERLDQRIARLMNWPLTHGEGFQILHYGIGGEYKPHFDYFPPDQTGSHVHTSPERGGQRVATLILYLNSPLAGGETVFPDINMAIQPQKGSGLYFSYCNSLNQLDSKTLHGGNPVTHGEKWIMTKWMRQFPY